MSYTQNCPTCNNEYEYNTRAEADEAEREWKRSLAPKGRALKLTQAELTAALEAINDSRNTNGTTDALDRAADKIVAALGAYLNRKPTHFEQQTMLAIYLGIMPIGDRQIKYVSAARRLERKGYAGKGTHWYLTKKGDDFINGPDLDPAIKEIKRRREEARFEKQILHLAKRIRNEEQNKP